MTITGTRSIIIPGRIRNYTFIVKIISFSTVEKLPAITPKKQSYTQIILTTTSIIVSIPVITASIEVSYTTNISFSVT